MIVHIFSVTIFVFIFVRLIWKLQIRLPYKTALFIILLLISQQHFINRIFFGTLASPELPQPVLIVQSALLSFTIILAMLLLLRDLTAIMLFLLRLGRSRLFLYSRKSSLAILALSLLLAPAGVWQAVKVPEVRRVEIRMESLPKELDGFTIVLLSDLHISSVFPKSWIAEVVERVNALDADLVVLAGDIIDGSTKKRAMDVVPLADLTARYGCYAAPGNHEYYSGYEQWMAAFSKLGLPVLQNQHKVIAHNGVKIVLAGTTDRVAARYGKPMPDLRKAIANAPKDAALRILLAHRPDHAQQHAKYGIDLQLSGHTHGGQIAGAHLLVQYINNGFVSDLYAVDQMKLYVSRGTALWGGFPLRLGTSSEITHITLRAKAE